MGLDQTIVNSFDAVPALPACLRTTTPPVVPRRSLDPHVVRHLKLPESALAIEAAEVMDGRRSLVNPTLEMVAIAVGVSPSYVAAARQLTPEQRQQVLRGWRPLVASKPRTPVLSIEQRFAALVTELGGVASALDQLAMLERNGSSNNGNGHAT
jgi:hypothetical protein